MKRFRQAAELASYQIVNGSLAPEDDPDTSYAESGGRQWLHKSSWKPVAEINHLGFITYMGQDAKDPVNGKIKKWERSYASRKS